MASRVATSHWMMSEFGSADLLMAMPVKWRPLTLRHRPPYAVASSVPGSVSPTFTTSSNVRLRERVDVTALPLDARAMVLRELRDAVEDRIGVEVRFGDDVGLEAAAQPVVMEVGCHRVLVG